jgi:hypothetical protein
MHFEHKNVNITHDLKADTEITNFSVPVTAYPWQKETRTTATNDLEQMTAEGSSITSRI